MSPCCEICPRFELYGPCLGLEASSCWARYVEEGELLFQIPLITVLLNGRCLASVEACWKGMRNGTCKLVKHLDHSEVGRGFVDGSCR